MAGRPKKRAREQAQQGTAQGADKPTEGASGMPQTSGAAQPSKKPVRRSESVVQDMLWRVAGDARSLRDVCQDEDMPSYKTAYDWLNADPDMRARYEMARAERGDFHGEQVLEIARQVREGELEPQAGKVAIDGVKWAAGRMAPKAWGDRSQLDMNVHNDPAEGHIEALRACMKQRQAKRVAAAQQPENEASELPDDSTAVH